MALTRWSHGDWGDATSHPQLLVAAEDDVRQMLPDKSQATGAVPQRARVVRVDHPVSRRAGLTRRGSP